MSIGEGAGAEWEREKGRPGGRHTIAGDDDERLLPTLQRRIGETVVVVGTETGRQAERGSQRARGEEGTCLQIFLVGILTFGTGIAHWLCIKKSTRRTQSPREAVLAFFLPFCARQDDGGREEVDHRKQRLSGVKTITRAPGFA